MCKLCQDPNIKWEILKVTDEVQQKLDEMKQLSNSLDEPIQQLQKLKSQIKVTQAKVDLLQQEIWAILSPKASRRINLQEEAEAKPVIEQPISKK